MAQVTSNGIRVAGVNPLAIEQAALLDDAFFDDLDVVFQADITKKISSLVIYNDIMRCIPADIRKAWPRVGSGKTEDGEVDRSCNNPDYTKALDGKRTVWVSYFDTMVLRSKRCGNIRTELDNKKDMLKQEKQHKRKMDLEDEINTLESQLSSYKATFRKGLKLLQQVEAQEEWYPDGELRFSKDADGNVKQVTTPIRFWPKADPLLGEVFTVTEFLSIDFTVLNTEEELDAQQKWDLLISTMKRGTPDEEEEDEDNINITNWKRFETGIASMLHWLENANNTTHLYGRLDKAKDIASYADQITTLVELAVEFNSIAEHLRKPGKGGSLYEKAMAVRNAPDSEAEDAA